MDAVIHRGVPMILVEDAILALELLSARGLRPLVAGRLGDRCLLLKPDTAGAVVEELRRLGHTPRTVAEVRPPSLPLPAPKRVLAPVTRSKKLKPLTKDKASKRTRKRRRKGKEPGYKKFNRRSPRK